MIVKIREQIYQFSQEFNYKIHEKPNGKATLFQRNKQNPIAEVDWDNKRKSVAIYLWLPFTTINGYWNMGGIRGNNYKRTSMMRLWIVDNHVQYVGYIENARKSWLIFTSKELESDQFSTPGKLKKQKCSGNNRYWKGLAMPTKFYLKIMNLSNCLHSLDDFVKLALNHSFQKQN